jgi:flagellar biosynthesis protein FliR
MTLNFSLVPIMAVIYLLMFTRIGTMLMLMPGLGERGVPVRIRLTIALLLTLILFPLHKQAYNVSLDLPKLLPLMAHEFFVGAVLGLVTRIAMSSLTVAGSVIAQQMGLSSAFAYDVSSGQQGAILASFMGVVGIALIFASDLHYLAIAALHDSYTIFGTDTSLVTGDVAQLMIKAVSGAFYVGIQISAPFIVFALIFNIGLGLLSKLMPQMQVFFVGLPLSLLMGFGIFFLIMAALMSTFIDYLTSILLILSPQ